MPTDNKEEPSNFALSISEKLVRQTEFKLTEEDRAKLTPYERAVLERTAFKSDMVGQYWLGSGEVYYRKRPESY
jgi:hypothetical protein